MRTLLPTVLALFLCIAAAPAHASIIQVSGEVEVLPAPPTAVTPSQSDTTIFGFLEQQGVVLTEPVSVGVTTSGVWVCCSGFTAGQIPAGDVLNSYLLYDAPVTHAPGTDDREFTGSITFGNGETIVGVMLGYSHISGVGSLFFSPTTVYPSGCSSCGLETGDVFTLSSNMQTISVDFGTGASHIDMIQILTVNEGVPEPAEFFLVGSGVLALGFLGRRRRKRQPGI